MDNEMIVRCANIIKKHAPMTGIGASIVAVELIQAMREPTPEMQKAWCGPNPWDEEALEVWQAMIDAITND